MHSSRMRNALLLTISHGGGSTQPPWMQTHPVGRTPWRQTLRSCDLWCMLGQRTPPPPAVNKITHGCKNITLPQTSFAGGLISFEKVCHHAKTAYTLCGLGWVWAGVWMTWAGGWNGGAGWAVDMRYVCTRRSQLSCQFATSFIVKSLAQTASG